LNLPDCDDFVLVFAWFMGALQLVGAYPHIRVRAKRRLIEQTRLPN
jgi:hypothetical protein